MKIQAKVSYSYVLLVHTVRVKDRSIHKIQPWIHQSTIGSCRDTNPHGREAPHHYTHGAHWNCVMAMMMTEEDAAAAFRIGQVVAVAPRTGPGQNELGGIARIVAIAANNKSSSSFFFDVKYVLDGRTEHNVAPEYLQPHSFLLQRTRRRVLGRCQRCGSLRSDCGACDAASSQSRRGMTATAVPSLLLQATTTTTTTPTSSTFVWSSTSEEDDDDNSDDSSAAEELQAIRRSQQRAFVRYKRRQAQARAVLNGHFKSIFIIPCSIYQSNAFDCDCRLEDSPPCTTQGKRMVFSLVVSLLLLKVRE